MEAILLAAGLGTRLSPLTDNRPKPLLEVAGRSILERTLSALSDLGIKRVVIIVHTKKDAVIEHVLSLNLNLEISFVDQGKPKGTGHATMVGLAEVKDDFVVINADILVSKESLENALNSFKERDTETSAVIIGAEVENPMPYGVLMQEKDTLKQLVEKPSSLPDGIKPLVNAGVYFFAKETKEFFSAIEKSPKGEYEIVWVLNKILSEGKQIRVSRMEERWFDIGYPWHLLEANTHYLEKESGSFEILGEVEEGARLLGSVHVAKGARVRSGAYIEGPVYIDEKADVGPNCYIRSGTYLGKATRVGNACEIKNSIFYHGTHAGHLSYVGDSILGVKCNLGAGTLTANLRHDGKNIKVSVKEERLSSGRRKLGVIMGDGVKTGINVSLLPGLKLSSNTMISAGETVNRDR